MLLRRERVEKVRALASSSTEDIHKAETDLALKLDMAAQRRRDMEQEKLAKLREWDDRIKAKKDKEAQQELEARKKLDDKLQAAEQRRSEQEEKLKMKIQQDELKAAQVRARKLSDAPPVNAAV